MTTTSHRERAVRITKVALIATAAVAAIIEENLVLLAFSDTCQRALVEMARARARPMQS